MICAKDVTIMDNVNIIPMELDDHVTTKQKNATTFILENGKKLLQCAREGDSEGVVRLLTKGAPITTDWLGTSPLHLAVMNNHYETCQVLLNAGVSKDGRTKVDRTPLHFAAYEGYYRIAKLLLKHGADVDCRDMLQMTPLHWAVEREHKDCVKVLLSFGAKINSTSRFNKTPLSIAVDMNWHEVVHLLQKASLLEAKQSIKNLRDEDQFKGSVHKITFDYDHDTLKLNNDKHSDSNNLGDIECDGIDSEKDVQNVLASLLPQVEESPNEATLQLLKEHGITMLPADSTNTVNSAMQCGRKIVLSDAGKLVLKDVSLQKDPPKPIEIKKKPIILPPSTKMKNAKIYTMTSSQLLAMTNKPNILQKLPDAVKKGTGINFVQLPKNVNISPVKITPYAKNIKIMNTVPMKTVPNSTLVKNPNTSTDSSPPLTTTIRGEVIKLSQLKNSKIIKLKNGTNLMNTVKLVIKNGLGKVSDVPEAVNKLICDNTSDSERDASTNEITSPLNNFAPLNDCIDLSNGTVSELEKLKSELMKAKGDLEYYKRKYQEAQAEIMIYKKGLSCHSLLEMETNSID